MTMSWVLVPHSLEQVLGGAASLTSDYGWALVVAAGLLFGLAAAARAVRRQAPSLGGKPRAASERRGRVLWLGAWLIVSFAGAAWATFALRSIPVDVRLDLEEPIAGTPEVLVSDATGRATVPIPMAALDKRFGIPCKPFVEIHATTKRRAGSVGSQVWVTEFPFMDQFVQDPPDTWKTSAEGGVGTFAPSPTTIRWQGNFERQPRIGLVAVPWGGIAEIRTAAGTQTVDLYAEHAQTLRFDIPASARTAAYCAQVPRSALRNLALRFPQDAAPKIVRFYAATFVPTILIPLGVALGADWGAIRTGWSVEPKDGVVPLPVFSAIERGRRATFVLLLALFLAGVGLTLAVVRETLGVVRTLWRAPLPDLPVAPWRWRRFLAFWLPAILYGIFWLLAFYPGCINPDSLDQWDQAKTGLYVDHHPPVLAFGIAVLTRVWDSPAIVTLAQILLFSFAGAFGADFLWRAGVRRWLVVTLYAVLLLSLKNADLAVSLLKDVPYSAGTLVVCVLLAELLVSGALRRRAWPWVALGLTLGGCVVVRNNGVVLAAVALPLALWAFREQWRRVALAGACALALAVAVQGGLYRALEVRNPPFDIEMYGVVSRIASVVDQYPALTPEEFESLDAVRSLDDGWAYDPVWMLQTFYSKEYPFRFNYTLTHLPHYRRLFFSMLARYPGVLLRHTARSQDYLFSPRVNAPTPIEMVMWGTAEGPPLAKRWGLKTESLLPGARRPMLNLLGNSASPRWNWLFWRPALSVYACLLAFIVLVWRTREGRFAIVYLAPLIVLPTLLAAFTQCVRYVLPVSFAAPFLVGLACLPWRAASAVLSPASSPEETPDAKGNAASSPPAPPPLRPRALRDWRLIAIAIVVALALALPAGLLARKVGSTSVGVYLDLEVQPSASPTVCRADARQAGLSELTPMTEIPARYVAGLRPWCEVQTAGEKNPASSGTWAAVWDLPDSLTVTGDPPDGFKRTGNVQGQKPSTVRWTGVYERDIVARFQKGPSCGIVTFRTAAGAERLDLYSPKNAEYVSRPVPAGQPVYRYFALVARRDLGALAIRLAPEAEGASPRIAGLDVGTLVPSLWYPLGPKPLHARGWLLSDSASPRLVGQELFLAPLSPIDQGGWATFLALWFALGIASAVLAAIVALGRRMLRSLRASLATPEPPSPRVLAPRSWRLFAAFLVPALAIWGFALLVFYPGAMQSDALDQWNQAHTMVINDWHPAFHTLTIRLLTYVWDSPAMVVIAQIVLMASFVAAGFSLLWRAGVPRTVVVAAYLASLLSPKNFTMVPNLVKDVPFACLIALLAVVLARGLLDNAARSRLRHALGLGLLLGLAPLFRHNGSVLSAVMVLALLTAWPRAWRATATAAIVALLLVTVCKKGVYPALQVEPRVAFQDGLVSVCAASMLDAGVPMSPDEYDFLDRVHSVAGGLWVYSPVAMGEFFHDAGQAYRKDFAVEHLPEYRGLLLRLAVRAPLFVVSHFVRNTGYLWIPWQTEKTAIETYTETYTALIVPEQELAMRHGLRTDSFFPRASEALTRFHWASNVPRYNWLLWYPGLHFWIVLAAAVVIVRRTREWRFLLVYLPFLLNMASLVVIWSQCLRYEYPLTLAASFLVALAFVTRNTGRKTEADSGTAPAEDRRDDTAKPT